MRVFCPVSEGFLVIHLQKVCGNEIQMCLIPNLVGVIYDGSICSKTPFKGLAPKLTKWKSPGPRGHKTIYMLNSTEHEISTAHKN